MWCLADQRSASTSRASSVSAEAPRSSGRVQRSSIDTSVTYNRRPARTAAAAGASTSVSLNGDQANEYGSASTSAGGRGRGGRETRKQTSAATSATTVETVKRKISSEWDDCMHLACLCDC